MSLDSSADWRLVNLRAGADPEQIEAVERMWREQAKLGPEAIAARKTELLMAAVSNNGAVIGVNTIHLHTPEQMRVPLWAYRTFVVAGYRQRELGLGLLLAAFEWLEARYLDGSDTQACGLYMEIENPLINRARNEAVWPRSQMAFVGSGPIGQVRRVRYFSGARLD